MMAHKNKRLSARLMATFAGSAALGTIGLLMPQAVAQEQDAILEEIVVTAQKRTQSLQDVPVSVTAFSGEAIDQLQFDNSVDIAAQTAGLNVGTPVGEGNNPSITLRGIGLNDFNDNNEGPIAVYTDEVYHGSLAGQTFQLFDIERVEVLRGPQGTLYGRNASGGLVHFITRRPTDEVEGFAEVTYGRFNKVKLESAVGGPLGDGVQARLSAAYHRHDGYVENRIGTDRNQADNPAVRLQVNFDLNEDTSLLLKGHWARNDVLAPAYQHQGTGLTAAGDPCPVSEGIAGNCTDFFGYQDTDGDNFAGEYNRIGVLDIEAYGASATLDWGLTDSIVLTSITAYQGVNKVHEEDTDTGPLDLANPVFALDAEQFSQELRLGGTTGRADWVAGFYYYKQDVDAPQDLIFGEDLNPQFFLDTEVLQDTRSWAIFAQTDFRLTDDLTLVGGIRYTDEHKDYRYIQADRLGGVTGLPPGTVLLDFNEEDFGDLAVFDKGVVTFRAGLNWTPTLDTLLYGNVSRGFKSGGFNSGFSSAPPEGLKYGEETLLAYEIGWKQTFANNRLRFNVSAFIYDYSDLQALTVQELASFITNASDANIKGIEFELQGSPIPNLDLNLGMSLLDTKADGIAFSDGTILEDRELVLAPNISFNGLARYSVPLENDGYLAAQVAFNYQGSHFFDIKNQAVSKESSYSVWDASVSYETPDERFQFTFWVKNVFNKNYRVYTFDFTEIFGFNQQFFGPPRWWGLTADYRF